jgi:hypothetical protein
MSVTLLNVLNTPSALGVDARVDANGFLSLQGSPAFKASSIDSVTITPYVAEVAQVSTVTIGTVSNNAVYTLSLICNDVNSGMITSVPLSVTSDSTASNSEIALAFAAAINSMPELSVTAAEAMSSLVVTAKAGFPIFTLATSDGKLSISTSAGTVGVGTGTSLIGTYPSTAGYFNAGGFTAASSIVATNNYTQVLVSSTTGSSAVILVNVGATAANVAALTGPVGTLTALKAGYRAIWSAPATTTAAVTVTTGAIALSGGSTTFATLGARGGDAIVIGSEITSITGVTGLTAGFGTLTTAVSAATFNFVALRNLPL